MRFLVFFFSALVLSFSVLADDSIIISKWQENTELTSYGKKSEILIQGKVGELPPNMMMTSFAISFDKSRNIKIDKVISDSRAVKYDFSNNILNIELSRPKSGNNSIRLYFTYDEKYHEIKKFLRSELIDVPPFAAGAEAVVTLKFPGFLESATLNPNVTKVANSFVYRNVVPKEGVREVIKLTSAENSWDIVVKNEVNSNAALGEVEVIIPRYFKNVGQKVEAIKTSANITPIQDRDRDKNKMKFNTKASNLLIETRARISTGKNNRTKIFRSPADYLKVSSSEIALLTPVLKQIKDNPNYREFPLYAKIGQFVHDYIKYDLSYVGKLPNVQQILQHPIGVCTEYATLFNALARVAKIPSFIVEGAACGEYRDCEGHVWNMIYYNNVWFPVDATWDLMSGIVSSSHVYFNDNGNGNSQIKYRNDGKAINSKVDFEMKLIN